MKEQKTFSINLNIFMRLNIPNFFGQVPSLLKTVLQIDSQPADIFCFINYL
jgi:hypothetical protein